MVYWTQYLSGHMKIGPSIFKKDINGLIMHLMFMVVKDNYSGINNYKCCESEQSCLKIIHWSCDVAGDGIHWSCDVSGDGIHWSCDVSGDGIHWVMCLVDVSGDGMEQLLCV